MPRDAHCVHSETLFAVAGSTLAFLGGQCKAAFAETFKFISQILFSRTYFSRAYFSRTYLSRIHWPRFVSILPWLTEATPNCAAQRLKNFLFQNFILQESVTKIRNGEPLFVSVFVNSLYKLAALKAVEKRQIKKSERGVVERKISRAQLAD
jgi:hypothetical protein